MDSTSASGRTFPVIRPRKTGRLLTDNCVTETASDDIHDAGA